MTQSAPRTARDRARVEITRAIQDSARKHLAEVGPAALSLRAIARDVGMVSSAVYRYFPSRDELLTALIVEAYDELGAAVEAADAGVHRRDDLAKRFATVCDAVHDWARAHPHEYALLYGSPVPGYAAPDTTVPAAARVTGAFLRLSEPVDFGAPDGEPVDLVFALVVPEHYAQQHLLLLANLAEMFGDAGFRQKLRQAPNSAALYTLLSDWQAAHPAAA